MLSAKTLISLKLSHSNKQRLYTLKSTPIIMGQSNYGSGYGTEMDRESGSSHTHGSAFTGDLGISIGDLGMSLGLGPIRGPHDIQAKLRPGVKKLEFVFMGTGKGSTQGHTPEQYGLKQRQALVEMGKANDVHFTTHSTVGVYGLAGADQQGNFSKQSSNFSLQEVKRAIEFAADVGRGGPVVVHTGEFGRPVADADWNESGKWANKFEMYAEEAERTSYNVIDTRTGGLIEQARKNRAVSKPVWNRAKEGDEYVDLNGEKKKYSGQENIPVYLDYLGKQVLPEDRVPKLKENGEGFEIRQMTWKELKEEADEFTTRARVEWQSWQKRGGKEDDTEFKKSFAYRFHGAKDEKDIQVRPEEAYIMAHLETTAAQARGWARYQFGNFDESIENLKKLEKARELYKQMEDESSEEEKLRLKRQLPPIAGDLIPSESELPTQIIDRQIRAIKRQIEQARESASSQWAQAEQATETMKYIESSNTYAIKEAAGAYASAAIVAYQQTERLKKENKLEKPIALALENLFPEHYGSHPDELIHLIEVSRKKMVDVLQRDFKKSAQEAKKLAEDHITSTFDTGHLNMWRKYWKNDPKISLNQNEEQFNVWLLEKVDEMAKKKIIGHVHIDDNYGYQDDHLAAGEGNTPVRDIIKVLKANGYNKEMIIEPGADFYTDNGQGFTAVSKTWRDFNIPFYSPGGGGSGRGGKRTWNDAQYGWVGQNSPPYFTFGGYSPNEEWTLWSGVPLE